MQSYPTRTQGFGGRIPLIFSAMDDLLKLSLAAGTTACAIALARRSNSPRPGQPPLLVLFCSH